MDSSHQNLFMYNSDSDNDSAEDYVDDAQLSLSLSASMGSQSQGFPEFLTFGASPPVEPKPTSSLPPRLPVVAAPSSLSRPPPLTQHTSQHSPSISSSVHGSSDANKHAVSMNSTTSEGDFTFPPSTPERSGSSSRVTAGPTRAQPRRSVTETESSRSSETKGSSGSPLQRSLTGSGVSTPKEEPTEARPAPISLEFIAKRIEESGSKAPTATLRFRPAPPRQDSNSDSDSSSRGMMSPRTLPSRPLPPKPHPPSILPHPVSASRPLPHPSSHPTSASLSTSPSTGSHVTRSPNANPAFPTAPKMSFDLSTLKYEIESDEEGIYESEDSYESDGDEDTLVYSWIDVKKTEEDRNFWETKQQEVLIAPRTNLSRIGTVFQQWIRQNKLPPDNPFRKIYDELSIILTSAEKQGFRMETTTSNPSGQNMSLVNISTALSAQVKQMKQIIHETLKRLEAQGLRNRLATPNLDKLDFHVQSFKLLSSVNARFQNNDGSSITSAVQNFTSHLKDLFLWYVSASAALKS